VGEKGDERQSCIGKKRKKVCRGREKVVRGTRETINLYRRFRGGKKGTEKGFLGNVVPELRGGKET